MNFILNVLTSVTFFLGEGGLFSSRLRQGFFLFWNLRVQYYLNHACEQLQKEKIIWFAVPNMFLAGQYPPEPEVVPIPVEPSGGFGTILSAGNSQNRRGKRSLPQDNTETLTS